MADGTSRRYSDLDGKQATRFTNLPLKAKFRLLDSLLLIGAKTWTWPNLRVIAAGGRTPSVDSAAAAGLVEKDTIVVSMAGEGKDFVLEIEMIDQSGFFQPFGELLGWFRGLEGINELHANKILNAHFHRQAAADRAAVFAQPFAVFDPGRRAVDVAVVSDFFCHDGNAEGTADNLGREQLEKR